MSKRRPSIPAERVQAVAEKTYLRRLDSDYDRELVLAKGVLSSRAQSYLPIVRAVLEVLEEERALEELLG